MTEYIDKIVNLLNETTKIYDSSLRSLLWWQVTTLGLTFGITNSKIFNKLREKLPFLKCTQCVGLWSGLFVAILDNQLFNIAFSGSFICFVTYLLLAELIKKHG